MPLSSGMKYYKNKGKLIPLNVFKIAIRIILLITISLMEMFIENM